VSVENVADPAVVPPAGVVDPTGRVRGTYGRDCALGIVLAPSFVERDPHDDAGVVAVRLDKPAEFGRELSGGGRIGRDVGIPGRSWDVRARHVLPNQKPHTIAQRVEAARLHLHVLAQHVEAHGFDHLEIVGHGFLAGCRVETVGPVALVQGTALKYESVVQQEP
jgi:hypothetical protein